MSRLSKFFYIQHSKSRICYSLTKNRLGVILESCIKLLIWSIWGNKGCSNAHLSHGYLYQVKCSTINRWRCNYMIATFTDIKKRKEISSLARRSQHCCSATLKGSNLCCYIIIGRILQSCIEIAASLKIKQLSHILTSIILKCSRLNDRNLTRLAITRRITSLHTLCIYSIITHFFTPCFHIKLIEISLLL